jgi:hypothetical protein
MMKPKPKPNRRTRILKYKTIKGLRIRSVNDIYLIDIPETGGGTRPIYLKKSIHPDIPNTGGGKRSNKNKIIKGLLANARVADSFKTNRKNELPKTGDTPRPKKK